MKGARAKNVSSRWSPIHHSHTIEAITLDANAAATNCSISKPPLSVSHQISNSGVMTCDSIEGEDAGYTTISSLVVTPYRSSQIYRRWSQGDSEFNIYRYCPRYVERLMELLYHEIDQTSRNARNAYTRLAKTTTRTTNNRFAQASVIAAAIAFKTQHQGPCSNRMVENVEPNLPTLDSKAMNLCASFDHLLCMRYASFAADENWVLLIILSHSKTFCHAAVSMFPDAWEALTACIKDNAVSLEVFAEVRGLDIATSLRYVARSLPPSMQKRWLRKHGKRSQIKPNMPYSYIIADKIKKVSKPMYEGKTQINISANIYVPSTFAEGGKPRHWPEDKTWPSDPLTRTPGLGACEACGKAAMCECDPKSCAEVTRPLVELRDFGVKGRGIRTLQRIKEGDLLHEYVGLIKSANDRGDPTYGMSIEPYRSFGHIDIGIIEAKRYGNWTRFINHSCNASTKFTECIIGNRVRIMVKAKRDIDMFEELTIHYGDDYWREKVCECGETCCKLSRQYAVERCLDDCSP